MQFLRNFLALFDISGTIDLWITTIVRVIRAKGLKAKVEALLGLDTEPIFVDARQRGSPPAVVALLGRFGIRAWGAMVFNNEIFFRVSKGQAAFAKQILHKHGYVLLHERGGNATIP